MELVLELHLASEQMVPIQYLALSLQPAVVVVQIIKLLMVQQVVQVVVLNKVRLDITELLIKDTKVEMVGLQMHTAGAAAGARAKSVQMELQPLVVMVEMVLQYLLLVHQSITLAAAAAVVIHMQALGHRRLADLAAVVILAFRLSK